MKKLSLILLVTAFVSFVSCKNEADPEADKSFFTKFYDHNGFNTTFVPLDVAQTSDGGYLVLGLKTTIDPEGDDVNPALIYLMKTDEFGEFKSDNVLEENFTTPAPSLLEVAGKFYFFCMDTGTTQLMEVSESGTIAEQFNVGGAYPLAAGVDGTSLLLLNFDAGGRSSILSIVSTAGVPGASKSFTIGAADGPNAPPDNAIYSHVLRTGRQLPFFVGKTAAGQYYFNGIYNYSLSTVFTDLNNDTPANVVQGANVNGGVSALYPLNGGKFAASRFNFGDNYILPFASIAAGSPHSETLGGNPFPELVSNAPVKIISATINANPRVLYGSNTRGKQIALYGYNPADGTLVGSRYIGFSNSFELASMKATTDDGLIVLGTTYIAGRFPRIALFKLSSEALGESFQ
jgi:hypothetical protein